MNKSYRAIVFVIVFHLLHALTANVHALSPTEHFRIAISKASPNYINWLHRSDSTIEIVNLFYLAPDSAVKVLTSCCGLLLTGGDDVFPAWYGKEADTGRCTGFDRRRDTLEMALIDQALKMRMPVFGVCRGLQILNVYLGGKLIVDIPADFTNPLIHQCDDYLNCFHAVYPIRNTTLAHHAHCDSASVTTNHHQAIDMLAQELAISARSGDGLPEAIEWQFPELKSFLMGVQWHPERMTYDNPLSGPLADEFIRQAGIYKSRQIKRR
jgi:putative glutamine amidotransferase